MNSPATLKASLCPIHSALLDIRLLVQPRSIHHVPLFTFVSETTFRTFFFFTPHLSSLSFYHPLSLSPTFQGEVRLGCVVLWMRLCAVTDASRSRVLSWILKRQMGVETEWDGNAMQL